VSVEASEDLYSVLDVMHPRRHSADELIASDAQEE
jgi:hypothetical protein